LTKNGSITSFQTASVPADNLTDPAPAETFAHLDSTLVLDRKIAALALFLVAGSFASPPKRLDPRIVGQKQVDAACGVQAVLRK
jgi:F-type H+-transporting ATPase subunit beta